MVSGVDTQIDTKTQATKWI